MDSFSAFEAFVARRYLPGESIDVYLSDLGRLAELNRTVEDFVKTAFVSGLPAEMRTQLKAASALETMSLPKVVELARAMVARSQYHCIEPKTEDVFRVQRGRPRCSVLPVENEEDLFSLRHRGTLRFAMLA